MKAILQKVEQFDDVVIDEISATSEEILTKGKFAKSIEGDGVETPEIVEPVKTEVIADPYTYVQMDENTFIKFDNNTKRPETIDLIELKSKKTEIEKRLAELNDYSDENLLAWAKKNYPTPEGLREKEQLEIELQSITNSLNEIDGN